MKFRIIYGIQDGHYLVHTKYGEVQSNKDEICIPSINDNKPQYVAFIKTVQENFEGLSKKEIATAKLARKSQVMIGYLSERDF